MTSATTTPSRGASRHRAEGNGYGLVAFAATIIAMDIVALWGLCAYGSRANLQSV